MTPTRNFKKIALQLKKKTMFAIIAVICIGFSFVNCNKNLPKGDFEKLFFDCVDLDDGGTFPLKYTGRGEDVSPEFILKNLSPHGKTIAIIFDDLDHRSGFNHWIIWNIPANEIIPGNIPEGKNLSNMGNAKQGIGYGNHKYRGPKPPKGVQHKYQFNIYVLDCELKINSSSHKSNLVKAMDEHIIQYGFINGLFE